MNWAGDTRVWVFALGSRDYIDHLGFIVEQCPRCHVTGVFSVYATRRKLTFYLIPTLSYGEQHMLECGNCGARFGVTPDQLPELRARVMSQSELAARITQIGPAQTHATRAATAAPSRQRTYYQVLQVDPMADPEVIEAAFKRLALKYHPDRSRDPNASRRMRELIEARDVLADPRKRRAYDASLGIVHPPEGMRADEV